MEVLTGILVRNCPSLSSGVRIRDQDSIEMLKISKIIAGWGVATKEAERGLEIEWNDPYDIREAFFVLSLTIPHMRWLDFSRHIDCRIEIEKDCNRRTYSSRFLDAIQESPNKSLLLRKLSARRSSDPREHQC